MIRVGEIKLAIGESETLLKKKSEKNCISIQQIS